MMAAKYGGSTHMSPDLWLKTLEELRSLAQMGLNYDTGDHFDRQRYQRLLEIISDLYSQDAPNLTKKLSNVFQKELGHITPKVGVDAAIFDKQKHIFLVQRKDDQCWGLPGGWCDLNETPRQALQRELKEELSLRSEIGSLVNVFTRLPGDFDAPHTSYHLVFLTQISEDPPCLQLEEIIDSGWFSLNEMNKWHRDHLTFAQSALEARFG